MHLSFLALAIAAGSFAPALAADSVSWETLCPAPDGHCQQFKAAAEAVGTALGVDAGSFTDPATVSCFGANGPCNLARREALAMAEALSDAYAIAFPHVMPRAPTAASDTDASLGQDSPVKKREAQGDEPVCNGFGETCQTEVDKAIAASTEVTGSPLQMRGDGSQWCNRRGSGCGKIKRTPLRERGGRSQWCDRRGSGCGKIKRSPLQARGGGGGGSQWCNRTGSGCGKIKHAIEHLADLVAGR